MNISYLSGIIDGEGYVGIVKCSPQIKFRETKYRYKPTIIIVNTNELLIDEISKNFKGNKHRRKGNQKGKIAYSFEFTHRNLKELIECLLPFLIVKKEQAILLLELISTFRTTGRNNGYSQEELNKKEQIYLKCKELNKRYKCDNGNRKEDYFNGGVNEQN